MDSQICNWISLTLILGWSLYIFYTKPTSIYGSFKKTTFHFWLAFWFSSAAFYLVLTFLEGSTSLFVLAISLAVTDFNSILMLAVYSSYTRAKEFVISGFLRTWIPLFCVLALFEFLSAAIGKDRNASEQETIRYLMLAPSLNIAMLASFLLGWGFHRRLGTAAVIFPFVSALWAFIQLPLYIFKFVTHNEVAVANLLWILVFLKIFIAFMFFHYLELPGSQESVILPPEDTPLPQTMKKLAKIIAYSAGSVLSVIKIVEWLSDHKVGKFVSRIFSLFG